MHYTPGLRLRASEQAEILGIDDAEMGEFAYDYVGLEQEIGHSTDTGVDLGENKEANHRKIQAVESTSASFEKSDARGT